MTVWKEPADVATTEDLGAGPAFPAFSGVIDGVILKVGNRVLVKDQLTSTENGYYVVAGIPGALTLTATSDTIEAEDVIRVSQGDGNAHTAWALIDATNRTFVRQDVKNYSFDSIAALKQFWQALPNATASIAGYYERGDKGGGDFTFIGVPESDRILSVLPVSKPISAVTDVDGLVTITAMAQGLGDPNSITTTYISGVTGLADKAYSVTVVNSDTFTINARIPGVSFAAGAKIQYIQLVTADSHGRATGQRISLSGVVNTDGAVDIRGVTDLCGVINDTSLSIPIATTGGTYTPGSHAVIGDDGHTVPATDLNGTFGGVWQRLRTDHFDVKWFGAKGNWNPVEGKGTDDLPAFVAALGAMAAGGRRSGKLVAEGHFYLSDTLVLMQTVLLEGTGQNEPERPDATITSRCWPGTMLVFPKNVTGIRIRGGAGLDNPTKTYGNPFPPSGEKTVLRNLTVYCKDLEARAEANECRDREDPCIQEGDCIHGIHASAPVRLENVTVEFFAHDGIHIVGGDCCKPLFNKNGKIVSDCDPALDIDCQPLLDNVGNPVRACDGNAAGSYVENCIVGGCGRDGFHFRGGDAATCVINCCSAVVNRRYGFFDKTRVNTYIGCHAEGNTVEYHTEGSLPAPASGYNSSTFVGCYAEGNGDRCEFYGDVTVIGGAIGDTNIKKDSTVFILEHGVASRSPYKYNNDRNGAGNRIVACLGSENGDAPDALSFGTPDAPNTDYNVLRYDSTKHWWELQNSSQHRRPIAFPTIQCGSRQAAPQFRHGIFLGGDAGAMADVSFIAAPTLPATQYSSDNAPLTYERGDVVWNSEPSPGGPLGWVCVQAGMQDQLRFATTGDLLAFDTALTLANPTSFAVNQFVTIAGVTGIRQIVALAGNVATLNTAGDNVANIVDGAVAVKMIGAIPNGSPALVVDDTSRLLIGQYIAIAGVTGRQKIVSLGTPAALECATAETYDFDDGFTLVVQIDNGPVQTVTFHTADFVDIHAALASEVAMLLDAALTYSSTTTTSGGTKVTITSDTKGVSSHVQVTGGTANTALGFSPIVVDGTANPVTIETPNGGTNATDAIIEFWPATFSTFGVVDSPSKSYAGNTLLTLSDRYVTVSAAGMIMMLPASPVDGQTHSIKSKTGVTTTVDTEGGVLTIDGQNSVTLAPGENNSFRYSAATGEWELR